MRQARERVLEPNPWSATDSAEFRRLLKQLMQWSNFQSLQQLEAVVRIPGPISYGQLRLHPWWDPLRDDTRFERLMSQAREPVHIK